ncbi:MAG: ABC-2 family transporter protein [Planctomycetes bacterium]|nr:ABC-2 family transporter protein [Planctomycetota bacterium]
MRRLIRAIAAIFRVELSTMVQYRGESVLWALWGVVYPAVAMAMWQAAARDPADGGGVARFGQGGFAAYFLASMVIGHLTTAWDAFEMGYFVRSGTYSGWLLQPLLPIWRSATVNFAWKLFTTTILVPIWLVIAWAARPEFRVDGLHLAAGVVSVVLAVGISFLWGYIVGLTAFWTKRTEAIGELWFGASLLFGGRLAPIELLPTPLRELSYLMPHQWTLGFPCEVLMGHASVTRVWSGLLWQLAWLAAGAAIFRLAWNASVRRYCAVGG